MTGKGYTTYLSITKDDAKQEVQRLCYPCFELG